LIEDMERFGYTPASTLNVPSLPGLSIHLLDLSELDELKKMNRFIFSEERVINSFEKDDLLILEARMNGKPVGFKVGYRENKKIFYSAKGGVMPEYRRKGIAIILLNEMMKHAADEGYHIFAFDTFPNLHPGMTILAMESGFKLAKADFNAVYKEYRLRFERRLV
jgi:predicted GNAT superfamily acetyltransferase